MHSIPERTGTLAFMANAGARAYNGDLVSEPPVRSRGKAPGQGVRGAEAESILKCRLQIFAVKCDENPTMSTLQSFSFSFNCDLTDPESLQYFVHGIIRAPFLPARRYASAGYRDRNVSVCPSVRQEPVLCQNEES